MIITTTAPLPDGTKVPLARFELTADAVADNDAFHFNQLHHNAPAIGEVGTALLALKKRWLSYHCLVGLVIH